MPGSVRRMVGCPTASFTNLQSLPSSTPLSFTWNYVDPNLILVVTFPVDMDQTVEPLPAQFIIEVDAAAKVPDTLGWTNPTTMTLTYAEAVLGPTVVRLQYPQMFPNFISLVDQPVFPFDLLGVEV